MLTEATILELNIKAIEIHKANDTMLSIEECAKYLGRHEETIRKWCRNGKIIAQYNGGWTIPKLQFTKQLVEKFINEKSPGKDQGLKSNLNNHDNYQNP